MYYNSSMEWEIEVTGQFQEWYSDLELADAKAVVQAIESLEQLAPLSIFHARNGSTRNISRN